MTRLDLIALNDHHRETLAALKAAKVEFVDQGGGDWLVTLAHLVGYVGSTAEGEVSWRVYGSDRRGRLPVDQRAGEIRASSIRQEAYAKACVRNALRDVAAEAIADLKASIARAEAQLAATA